MTETFVRHAIASSRAGVVGGPVRAGEPRSLDAAAVLTALADVPDPEIPIVSIVDLGMVGAIRIDADGIRVTLLPTFVGCPALDLIRSHSEERLRAFERPVHVQFDFAVPWTSDLITAKGRAKLRASGVAPPAPARPDTPLLIQLESPVSCPNCGSPRTVLENAFGPTRCRAIYHCAACRQPFETFKTI